MNAQIDSDTATAEKVRPKISLAVLEAMADWKEALQGRIECARVRLNLGLPDNDAQLATEVAEFTAECGYLCGQLRSRAVAPGHREAT